MRPDLFRVDLLFHFGWSGWSPAYAGSAGLARVHPSYPDRTFRNFRASKSFIGRFLTKYNSPIAWFRGCTLVKMFRHVWHDKYTNLNVWIPHRPATAICTTRRVTTFFCSIWQLIFFQIVFLFLLSFFILSVCQSTARPIFLPNMCFLTCFFLAWGAGGYFFCSNIFVFWLTKNKWEIGKTLYQKKNWSPILKVYSFV